eukprot:232300-Chlamydomonas_euryale.AAC.1
MHRLNGRRAHTRVAADQVRQQQRRHLADLVQQRQFAAWQRRHKAQHRHQQCWLRVVHVRLEEAGGGGGNEAGTAE